MRPVFSFAQLKATKPHEYVLRFCFGGMVAVFASLMGHAHGPAVGGLFLAFPALLPAALTLVKQHDGRAAAADDARGAVIGGLGLAAFALVVWRTAASTAPWLSLLLSLAVWVLLSVSLWWGLLKTP
jgi:hypothetical protein